LWLNAWASEFKYFEAKGSLLNQRKGGPQDVPSKYGALGDIAVGGKGASYSLQRKLDENLEVNDPLCFFHFLYFCQKKYYQFSPH